MVTVLRYTQWKVVGRVGLQRKLVEQPLYRTGDREDAMRSGRLIIPVRILIALDILGWHCPLSVVRESWLRASQKVPRPRVASRSNAAKPAGSRKPSGQIARVSSTSLSPCLSITTLAFASSYTFMQQLKVLKQTDFQSIVAVNSSKPNCAALIQAPHQRGTV